MSPVGELLFFLNPFFFLNRPPLSTLSDNRKKLYSYSLFHPDSIYSSNNNISYSENCIPTFIFQISRRQPFSTIQKKSKETKKGRNLVTKTCKKKKKTSTTIAPNLPTTHLFRVQIQTKAVTKNTLKIFFYETVSNSAFQRTSTTVYIFSYRFIFYNY